LSTLYELCERQQANPAIDFVLEALDELIQRREYDRCNKILDAVDVGRLSVHAMLTFLAVTLRGKAVLPSRSGFFERVERRLRVMRPEKADALMAGLE
jgi:hypothetical protein